MELILTILHELGPPQIIPEGLDPARQTLEDMAVASAAQGLTASLEQIGDVGGGVIAEELRLGSE